MWWSFIINLGISTMIIVTKSDYKRFRLSDNPIQSITCKPNANISINNVYVEDGKCNSSNCVLEDSDHALIYSRCNESTACLLDFNLTSSCLLEKRHFSLFYGCKESYACNFEQDFCNWLPGNDTSAFNWKRIRAAGLNTDYTTGSGYYIFIEGTGGNDKRHAELSTGFIVSNRSKCISFWYNMNSVSDVLGSKLELFQITEKGRSSLLKGYIKSTQNRWILETVDLSGTWPHKIIFRGTVFGQWTNYIGLDDIDILPENCSGKTISEIRFFQKTCLNIDDKFTIDGCPSLYHDTSELQLVFEPALESPNMKCQGIENKIKETVLSLCKEDIFTRCDVNPQAIIDINMSEEQECMIYNKEIVLEYSCTELPSLNDHSTVQFNTDKPFDMTGFGVAIAACGVLVVCLIIAGISVFKRKTEGQRTLNTDKTSNKTGSMDINKTKEAKSTSQRDVSLVVHEYIDIALSKKTLCSDQTKHKENIFEYELANPLTSDTGGAFRYDLAKPLSTVVKDGRSTDFSDLNTPKDCSEYDTTKMNDSTKYNGYSETENIVVYSRTFDGVYDVASSGKRNVTSDNTYEHCALQVKNDKK